MDTATAISELRRVADLLENAPPCGAPITLNIDVNIHCDNKNTSAPYMALAKELRCDNRHEEKVFTMESGEFQKSARINVFVPFAPVVDGRDVRYVPVDEAKEAEVAA